MTCEPDHLLMGMSSETFWGGKEGNAAFSARVAAIAGEIGIISGAAALHRHFMGRPTRCQPIHPPAKKWPAHPSAVTFIQPDRRAHWVGVRKTIGVALFIKICIEFCTVSTATPIKMLEPAMTPLTEVRSRLSEIVDEVASIGSTVEISRHGRPVAVVVGYEEYESLLETLNILADESTMDAIAEAERDIAAGELISLD